MGKSSGVSWDWWLQSAWAWPAVEFLSLYYFIFVTVSWSSIKAGEQGLFELCKIGIWGYALFSNVIDVLREAIKANSAQLWLYCDGLAFFFGSNLYWMRSHSFKDLHEKGVAGLCTYTAHTCTSLCVAYTFYFNIILVIQRILVIIIMQSTHIVITPLITALVFFYSLDFQGEKRPISAKINKSFIAE